MGNYYIKDGYKCNLIGKKTTVPYFAWKAIKKVVFPFSDWKADASIWQYAAYEFAANVYSEKIIKPSSKTSPSVLDIGCGYGFKAKEFFYPICKDFTGIDAKYFIKFCKKSHSFGQWLADNIENPKLDLNRKFDLIISMDVIEHLVDPDKLLQYIKKHSHPESFIVISTPERDLTSNRKGLGPPDNKLHIREWNRDELHKYIESTGFLKIQDHFVVESKKGSKKKECQVILCKPI